MFSRSLPVRNADSLFDLLRQNAEAREAEAAKVLLGPSFQDGSGSDDSRTNRKWAAYCHAQADCLRDLAIIWDVAAP